LARIGNAVWGRFIVALKSLPTSWSSHRSAGCDRFSYHLSFAGNKKERVVPQNCRDEALDMISLRGTTQLARDTLSARHSVAL